MKPRIYVTCLASYNHGHLHGEWVDADQDADAINEAIQAVLKSSPIPLAEEFAIHAYDEFGTLRVDEYQTVEWVSVVGQAIAEHGDAMAAWLDNDRPRDADEAEERVTLFEDAFRGEWGNAEEYADNMLDDMGAHAALEPFGASVRIDVEGFARDLVLGGDIFTVDSIGGVYVFDNNV